MEKRELKVYELKLNEEELNVIGQSLGVLQYNIANPIIMAINKQIQEAHKPKEKKVKKSKNK